LNKKWPKPGMAALPAMLVITVAITAGCVSAPRDDAEDRAAGTAAIAPAQVSSFSGHPPGAALPPGWEPWIFSAFKRPTDYRLVDEGGTSIIHAHAQSSASGIIHPLLLEPQTYPLLAWRWKTDALLARADNTRRHLDDAPLRLLVAFDGDRDALPLDERLLADSVRLLTGRTMPYATLVYILENRAPVGTIIPNRHTPRIKMIVAASGADGLGAWQHITRNVVEDYRRAFGAEPGKITAVGIMTDTDNTHDEAQSWYGDIVFRKAAQAGTASTR